MFATSEVSTRSLPGWLEGSIKSGNMKEINSVRGEKKQHKYEQQNLAQHIPLFHSGLRIWNTPSVVSCLLPDFFWALLLRLRPVKEQVVQSLFTFSSSWNHPWSADQWARRAVVLQFGVSLQLWSCPAFTRLQKMQNCSSKSSTLFWYNSELCLLLCNDLATEDGELAAQAVWRAVMGCRGFFFFGAAGRRLLWKPVGWNYRAKLTLCSRFMTWLEIFSWLLTSGVDYCDTCGWIGNGFLWLRHYFPWASSTEMCL